MDFSLKKSWGTAHEDCLARGANLVSIHNQEEEEFLSLYSKGSSKWIGLKSNPTEGGACRVYFREQTKLGSKQSINTKHDSHIIPGYSWSDGSPLSHTHWGEGEPNNHEGREDCVEMVSSTNGTYSWWNDLNCDAHQDWICMIAKGKTPLLPPVPPPPLPGQYYAS